MGDKIYTTGVGHITKMAAMPMYGKKPFLTLGMEHYVLKLALLAHLSRRLTGELIGYQWIRRPSVVVVRSHFQTSSETTWPIKAQFYDEPPWEGGTKVCINDPGHMTKMAAMPIYGKNLKNLLFQNQKSYDLETWHVASGTQALHSLYK